MYSLSNKKSEEDYCFGEFVFPSDSIIDVKYVDGKKEGRCKIITKNKVLVAELNFHEDLLDGNSIFYNDNGEITKYYVYDNVNSKSLDYSAYNIIFHHLSVFCTIISWIAVLILLILHITSIHFSTFRVIFVSFFVCPLAVAILEGIFQHLYVAYSIGYWKFMKVDDYEEFHCRLLTN